MLQFRSRSCNLNPSLPRVFFCCHPAERAQYLDLICDAVLSAYDCLVCWPPDLISWNPDLEDTVSSMNLIILPLTVRFMDKDNGLAHAICDYANKTGIPILPIIVDKHIRRTATARWRMNCWLHMDDLSLTGSNIQLLSNTLIPYLEEKRPEGSWIFLSHSSADIQKIRRIRNRFEQNGHNPLAFHLKCLRTDTEEGRKELLDLIQREIDARDWFVFCESDAANNSEYVSIERAHVINANKKKIWTLDMYSSDEDLMAAVDRICQQVSVYISYRKKEHHTARLLQRALAEKDFDVWFDDFLIPGFDFSDMVAEKIRNCHYFVALITHDYEESFCGHFELPFALQQNKRIIPIIVGDAPVPFFLRAQRCYRIPELPHVDDIRSFAEYIEADLRIHLNGPADQADAFESVHRFDQQYT